MQSCDWQLSACSRIRKPYFHKRHRTMKHFICIVCRFQKQKKKEIKSLLRYRCNSVTKDVQNSEFRFIRANHQSSCQQRKDTSSVFMYLFLGCLFSAANSNHTTPIHHYLIFSNLTFHWLCELSILPSGT